MCDAAASLSFSCLKILNPAAQMWVCRILQHIITGQKTVIPPRLPVSSSVVSVVFFLFQKKDDEDGERIGEGMRIKKKESCTTGLKA